MFVRFFQQLLGRSPRVRYLREFLAPKGNSSPLPLGVFQAGTAGEVAMEFLWHGGEFCPGQLVLLGLDGLEDYALDSPALTQEILRRIDRGRLNRGFPRAYLGVSDLTSGARFGSWGSYFNSDRARGLQRFPLRRGERFCFLMICETHLGRIRKNISGVDAETFCFSFFSDRFVDVTGQGKIFAFADRAGYYENAVFRLWGATGKAISLDTVTFSEVDWRQTKMGKELLAYALRSKGGKRGDRVKTKTRKNKVVAPSSKVSAMPGSDRAGMERSAIAMQSGLVSTVLLEQLGIDDLLCQ